MTRLTIVAAVLSVAALTGCATDSPSASNTATPTVTSRPTQTPTATPTPTPSYMTMKEAAAKYVAIVAPLNKVVFAWNAEDKKAHPSLTKRKAYAKAYGDQMARLIRDMQAAKWPPELQSKVDAVIKDAAPNITAAREAQAAKTLDEYNAVEWPKSDGSPQVLRAALGLPEIPTS